MTTTNWKHVQSRSYIHTRVVCCEPLTGSGWLLIMSDYDESTDMHQEDSNKATGSVCG